MTAENTRHLEDLCTEELWPDVRAAGAGYEPVRRHFGVDACGIAWVSTDSFVCSLGLPEEDSAGDGGPTVIAGARFFSVMSMKFDQQNVKHTIDDLIFKSSFNKEDGVTQWKIAYIGGP